MYNGVEYLAYNLTPSIPQGAGLFAIFNTQTDTLTEFVRAGGETLAHIESDGRDQFVAAENAVPPTETNAASGDILWRKAYKPYGESLNEPMDASTLDYTGHIRDDSGLVYMQARYYDPVIGRFYGSDPIGWTGEIDSFNRYVYVGNNPYKYVDPDGQLKRNIFGEIVFDKVGSPQMANHESGVSSMFQPGHVTADDGEKIVAFKNVGKDARLDTDCHGQTFTKGKLWINNDQVDGILKGDNYKQVDTPKAGDVVVYKEDGSVVHSATVSNVDTKSGDVTVTGLGGIDTTPSSSSVVPGEGGGWQNSEATYE